MKLSGKTKKKLAYTAAIAVFAIFSTEIILRELWGFCDAPLSIANDQYEYIFAPSQHRHRFGKEIQYNSYSQRSEEPDSTRRIVLGIGDSIINGGTMTDQSELATTLASDSTTQILNISAGSWGPDNCFAYLQQFGTFGAKIILLVVSSHDAHDIMDFQPVVGSKAYPDRQYRSAIIELLDRYVIPRVFGKWIATESNPDKKVTDGVGIDKDCTGSFNPGFDNLSKFARKNGLTLKIYLHADLDEVKNGTYNSQGAEIIQWAERNNLPLTKGLDFGENESMYRDGIHFNVKGQELLSQWFKNEIQSIRSPEIQTLNHNAACLDLPTDTLANS
ncbi:MAG: hypothetical protein K2K36_02165 [Muribaculaceae bacterium]|nr:hypothetical protein [Muribaculaceae bacterium]